jgi:ribonucleoside-triphosphate reductase
LKTKSYTTFSNNNKHKGEIMQEENLAAAISSELPPTATTEIGIALPTEYQRFIHLSRYARYNEEVGRRETWGETVARYFNFFEKHILENYPSGLKKYKEIRPELETAVLQLEVMPSMRCLMTAGKALERDTVAGYNCSFLAVDSPRAFDETMYILMCGTGVGFSVERQEVVKMPVVAEDFHPSDSVLVVPDSKLGWATSFRELIAMLYTGRIPKWDLSRLRPAGARLKTFGGRSSGPEPLDQLFRFTVETFVNAAGRKLTSIECHDLMCKVGDVVVVGGVRRSALISLSNLSDDRMRLAKSGKWWEQNGQRALANNSVAYTEKPDMEIFMKEWISLVESKAGERGIFNVEAAQRHASKNGRRDGSQVRGTNPCSEILLRSKQFCNLSEVVVRPNDDFESLARKVRLATILGTLQASLVNFRYLSRDWRRNTEEEALLGVSLTGIMDNEFLSGKKGKRDITLPEFLRNLRDVAIDENKTWSGNLGTNQSTAITCVKPSGTVSQLVDSASGIHPRYADYYIRTVRADKKDPLAQFMADAGFPVEDDVTKPEHNYVFGFPMKSPRGSVMRDAMGAIEQLELWKVYAEHWCEHKPSITVYVKDHEWLEVGAWVYKYFDYMSGVAFLPHTNHSYRQAPYQEITKEEYDKQLGKMPHKVDWLTLNQYEEGDNTSGSQTLACSAAGGCDIVDLTED